MHLYLGAMLKVQEWHGLQTLGTSKPLMSFDHNLAMFNLPCNATVDAPFLLLKSFGQAA